MFFYPVFNFKPLIIFAKHSILDAWGILNTPVLKLHLIMFCAIITNIWWDIPNSYLARGWFVFLWIFHKNCSYSISSKSWRRQRLIAFVLANAIQYPRTLKNNIYHSNKRGPSLFFYSDTNSVLSHVLVHSVDKNHNLDVTVELILLLLLNILYFNFVPTPNKSLRSVSFRRSYVNSPAVILTNHCQSSTFLLDVRCSKWLRSFFWSCLSLIIVHLRNVVLLSKPVARMLLTPRWVSRRKDAR